MNWSLCRPVKFRWKNITCLFLFPSLISFFFYHHYLSLDRSQMNSTSPSSSLVLFWLSPINNLVILSSLENKSSSRLLQISFLQWSFHVRAFLMPCDPTVMVLVESIEVGSRERCLELNLGHDYAPGKGRDGSEICLENIINRTSCLLECKEV